MTPKIAIYREDGAKLRVRVLSDRTVGDFRIAELECIETVRPHPIGGVKQPGERFEATCKKGYESYVGWTLTEE